jgi:hypothetical protein
MTISEIPASGRCRYGVSLPLIFGLGVYPVIAGHGGAVLRWIVAHLAVPYRGIFSATMAQAPWVAHEWLGEVLLAWLFDTFGWAGLVAFTAFCVGTAVAILLRELLRSVAPVHAMIATALAVNPLFPACGGAAACPYPAAPRRLVGGAGVGAQRRSGADAVACPVDGVVGQSARRLSVRPRPR